MVFWQPGTDRPCTLLALTAAPTARVPAGTGFDLPHDATSGYNPGTNIFPAGGYDQGALVINVSEVTPRHFAIDKDVGDPNKLPRLVTWTTANAVPSSDTGDIEVVAEGIEDMQIAFACDEGFPGDGIFEEGTNATARITDEWAYNVAGETDGDGNQLPDPMYCPDGIGAVRITLVARSASEDTTADTVSVARRLPAAENRPEGSPDAYHRRKLTVLIHPRNTRLR
jgi:hypothetical protein